MLPEPLAILQVTAVLLEFVTVALNVCVCPICTLAVAGLTLTETGGGGGAVSVMVALAPEFGLATELARTVTLDDAGIVVGAV